MRNIGLSDWIRERAVEREVMPALKDGRMGFSIAIKPLMGVLESEGFPPNHPAQFCSALQLPSFLKKYGLLIEEIEGPKSKMSTTVVIHYRVVGKGGSSATSIEAVEQLSVPEDSAARAKRLTDKLRGLLKNEIAAFGGADAFIQWIRSDDDDENAA